MLKDFIKALVTAIYCALLYSSGQMSPFSARSVPLTWVDHAIPFWPVMLVPYLLLFPLLILTYTALDRPAKHRFLIHAAVMQTLAAIIFFLFPTRYHRDPWLLEVNESKGDVFSKLLLNFWQHIDPPGNCLPSLHVSSALLCTYYLVRKTPPTSFWQRRGLPVIAMFSAVVICISTISVRQHFAYDVLGGVILFLGLRVIEPAIDR